MITSDTYTNYRDILAASGLRVTPQRLLVMQIVDEGHGHLTADAIGARIRERFPAIHQGTIYRALALLREAGLVSETHLSDRAAVYELVGTRPHHHLVCDRCGGITEIDDAPVAALRADLAQRFGFHARTDHMAIAGLCRDCRMRQDGPTPASGEIA